MACFLSRLCQIKDHFAATHETHHPSILTLRTENLDALFEQLEAQGVHFASSPVDRPWEQQMFTNDPDGYRLEIAQGRRG